MGLNMDTEWITAALPLFKNVENFTKPPVYDVEGRRSFFRLLMSSFYKAAVIPEGVIQDIYYVRTPDGYQLPVYHFRLREDPRSKLRPAVLHAHGGGFITQSAAVDAERISKQVVATGVQVFSVDYRLAPEHPYPIPLEDCWTALTWVLSKAFDFSIDKSRIAVTGESAGGGLAAGLALLARERDLSPPLAKQILACPMLDDRNSEGTDGNLVLWSREDNVTGWAAYLGDAAGKDGVPAFAAPGRIENVDGMPPLYIDIGQIDIFAKENLEYVRKYMDAGIETEFHLYPGMPHGYDGLVPSHSMSKVACENRYRVLRKLLVD